MSSRRDFLKASGLVIMAGAAGYLTTDQFVNAQFVNYGAEKKNASADSRQRPTLVTIFLRGGADAVNAFVPYGDPLYYKYRTHIALHPGRRQRQGRRKGRHPALRQRLLGHQRRHGIARPAHRSRAGWSRSSTSARPTAPAATSAPRTTWNAARRGNGGVTTGWLNRYLEKTKKPLRCAAPRPLRPEPGAPRPPRQLPGARRQQPHRADGSLRRPLLAQEPRQHDRPRRRGRRARLAPRRPGTKAAKGALTSDMTRDVIAASGAASVERIKALEKAEQTANDASYPGGGLGRPALDHRQRHQGRRRP